MIASTEWNTERMAASCTGGHANATDVAEYLVRKGLPFRKAHEVAAGIVRECIEKGITDIRDLPPEQLMAHSPLIGTDLPEQLSPEACVLARDIPGGPNPDRVRAQIDDLVALVTRIREK
jgi:argininosuccinate lyase